MLLIRRKDIDDAIDRLRCVERVQRGQHEMSGFRSGQRDADGFEVAQFRNHDHIRVLAHRLAQGDGE